MVKDSYIPHIKSTQELLEYASYLESQWVALNKRLAHQTSLTDGWKKDYFLIKEKLNLAGNRDLREELFKTTKDLYKARLRISKAKQEKEEVLKDILTIYHKYPTTRRKLKYERKNNYI